MSGECIDPRTAAIGYEELLVPALFGQWTGSVAEAAGIGPDDRVLDVACGTGILAREALARVGASGRVAGVDPGRAMLDVAELLAPAVEWRQAPAEDLPYDDESFDAVVSQFGMMFFTDRPRALREMLRVLAAHGRLAIAVWDRLENIPAYAAEVELLDRLAGTPAAEAVRAPFVLGDRKELESLLAQAGVPAVAAETRPGKARFPSVRSMVEADLRGWLPVMGVVLDEDRIQTILAAAETELAPYRTGEGSAEFDVSAHIVFASKP